MIRRRASREPQHLSKMYLLLALVLVVILCAILIWWFGSGWNGKEPVNAVVVVGEEVYVVGLRPSEQRAVSVKIPGQTLLDVPRYGRWQARALPRLAQLVNDQSVVESVATRLLGVPTDLIINLGDWEGGQTSYRAISTRSLGNLPTQIRMLRYIRSLTDYQISEVDLGSLSFARKVIDPGDQEMLIIDQSQLSLLVGKWFEIAKYRSEGLTIAVRNKSGENGAGGELARQLEHTGLRVVSVNNLDGETGIFVSNPQLMKNTIVKRLSRWFNLSVKPADFEERADVLMVI